MNETNETNKVNGTWKGMPCSIKKIWGKNDNWSGHEFTAEECTKLFNDEIIEFEAISKTGKSYTAKGKLEKQSFTDNNGVEHEYVGFTIITNTDVERFTGTWNNKEVKIKRIWSGHRFTDLEIQCLLRGDTIAFDAISQRTGNAYKAKGKLAEQTYNGNTFIGFKPEFD